MVLVANSKSELEMIIRQRRRVWEQVMDHEGFLIKDFQIIPEMDYYRTNNFLQRSLSYLLGWDSSENKWVRLSVDSSGNLNMSVDKASNISNGAITVTTTATQIVAARSERKFLIIKVPAGGATVYIGDSGVTTANGLDLDAGETLMIDDCEAAIYGIVASGTQTVKVIEGW